MFHHKHHFFFTVTLVTSNIHFEVSVGKPPCVLWKVESR